MKQVLNGIDHRTDFIETDHIETDHIECNTVVDEEGNEFMYYRWYDKDGNLKDEFLEEIESNDEWLDQVLR